MIPPAFLQDLLNRVDIAEVVGRSVTLKKSGANLSGLCPFHAEKSPSFTVSPTKQFYHCFGCGAHGDAIGFLVEQHGMSFIDAVQELAGQVGMTVPEDRTTPQEREQAAAQKQRRASLSEVLARAAEHYRRQLRGNQRAVAYLKGRGLTGEIAARFGLGYAHDGKHGLASAFPAYDDPLLEESGLVIVKDGDDAAPGPHPDADAAPATAPRRYDRFRDRIMFPIRSVQGDVIGFGGRVLDRGEPKYLNSPETPVFVKGRELYGLYEARTAMRERGHALVVEGYMDVVALAQSGFGNAVATLGTACTPDHVQKLFRFTESVVFSFDGDAAGRRAAGRALEAALPHATDTRTIRFLFLPEEHDPDTYVRECGADAFEEQIARAVPLSRQLIQLAADGCDLDSAEGRARLVAQARPLIARLPPGVLRGQIVAQLAETARIAPSELGETPPATSGGAGPAARDRAPSREPRRSRRPLATMASSLDRAVWMLVQRSELWERLGHDAHDLLSDQPPPYGDFFAWLDRIVHDQGTLAAGALLDEMSDAAAPEAFGALAARVRQFHDMPVGDEAHVEMGVILDRLRLQLVGGELELMLESGGAQSDEARTRQRELYRQQAELKKRLATAPGAAAH
ncbi:MAG: DNA primase [Proteobacteria bacterium]|nr:DNA primase [Pseudomonadota bacterium]